MVLPRGFKVSGCANVLDKIFEKALFDILKEQVSTICRVYCKKTRYTHQLMRRCEATLWLWLYPAALYASVPKQEYVLIFIAGKTVSYRNG